MSLVESLPATETPSNTEGGCQESVDPYSKDAINQLFRRQPHRFRFVSKFNAKSASWKDFELVYLDSHLKDFARCVHCKSFVTYSSKKGTGGMLRHRCVGKDGSANDNNDSPPAKKSTSSISVAARNISAKPMTIVTGPAPQRSANGLCTLLNLPANQGNPIQTIIYNSEQGNVLNLQNLTKLGLAVQTVKNGQTNLAISKIIKPEPKQEVQEDKPEERPIKEEKNDVNGVEQIVSNVEIHEDVSYDAPSTLSDDQRDDDYSLLNAPAEVQLADLQVRHQLEEHSARMQLYRRQLEVAELEKEFWRNKLKCQIKSSKASEDDGIHSDD